MQFALNITAATSFILCKVTVKWTYCEHRTACSAKVCSGQCALDSKGGCQVGSLLLLCHYSSFLSTFPNPHQHKFYISKVLFLRCTHAGLDEVKPFPDLTSPQSRLPMQRKTYSCPELEIPLQRITKSYEMRCIHFWIVLCKGRRIWI